MSFFKGFSSLRLNAEKQGEQEKITSHLKKLADKTEQHKIASKIIDNLSGENKNKILSLLEIKLLNESTTRGSLGEIDYTNKTRICNALNNISLKKKSTKNKILKILTDEKILS